MRLFSIPLILISATCFAQSWTPLFNGKNLDGWEVRGDAYWNVLPDGVLIGQATAGTAKNPFGAQWPIDEKQYFKWGHQQAWLYTKADFHEYDLELEYCVPAKGNSGISIRDTSRARYSFGPDTDFAKTPSHVGYEIQILNAVQTKFPSGSIYLFAPAKFGTEVENGWNKMRIESRDSGIRIKLNGNEVAFFAGEPGRPKAGPIGLQLHDRFTVAMFRNIRIAAK